MAEDEDMKFKAPPTTETEFNAKITKPQWGDNEAVSTSLKEKLKITHTKYFIRKGETYYQEQNGKTIAVIAAEDRYITEEEFLWGSLSFITQDVRLSNLHGNDLEYVEKYLIFSGDCLAEGYSRGCIKGMLRAAIRVELSQGRKGFLRQLLATLIKQTTTTTKDESPKRSVFGNFFNRGGNQQ